MTKPERRQAAARWGKKKKKKRTLPLLCRAGWLEGGKEIQDQLPRCFPSFFRARSREKEERKGKAASPFIAASVGGKKVHVHLFLS